MTKFLGLLVPLAILISLAPAGATSGQAELPTEQRLPPVLNGDSRWGVNHAYPSVDSLPMARSAGARWNRWEFRWANVEQTPGQFQYGTADVMVGTSAANGLSMQGILISVPDWAMEKPSRLPRGLYLAWNDPGNLWTRFVTETVTRFRGRIRYWEVWNEPDLAEVFWGGTTADYYQLLKVSYQAIKAVDPSAQVLLAGLAYWPNPGFLEDLLGIMRRDPTARGNNFYFDILPWHQYARPSDLWDRVTQSRQLLATTVGTKPIWVNEANVPAWDESPMNDFKPYNWSASVREQASYVIQAMAYAVAAGAERVFVYRLQDTEWPEAYGLLRPDGSARPAYVAFQVATRYLSHVTSASVTTQGPVEQIVLRRADQRVLVVWNKTPLPVRARVAARAAGATVIEQNGATRSMEAVAGQYDLDLAPATANNGVNATDYIIGGPPLILVESGVSNVRGTAEPSPVILPAPTAVPTAASVLPGTAPTPTPLPSPTRTPTAPPARPGAAPTLTPSPLPTPRDDPSFF
jgi:hypothetical protein